MLEALIAFFLKEPTKTHDNIQEPAAPITLKIIIINNIEKLNMLVFRKMGKDKEST